MKMKDGIAGSSIHPSCFIPTSGQCSSASAPCQPGGGATRGHAERVHADVVAG